MNTTSTFILASLLGTNIGITTGARLANKEQINHLVIAIITILSSVYMQVMLKVRA
jgi:uncharacterized membrane protein YfcA